MILYPHYTQLILRIVGRNEVEHKEIHVYTKNNTQLKDQLQLLHSTRATKSIKSLTFYIFFEANGLIVDTIDLTSYPLNLPMLETLSFECLAVDEA
jgi:hypothetical protein